MNNPFTETIRHNVNVSIQNACNYLKKTEVWTEETWVIYNQLVNAQEILSLIDIIDPDEAVLNNFSQAYRDIEGERIENWQDQESDVQSEMLVKHGHEQEQFTL